MKILIKLNFKKIRNTAIRACSIVVSAAIAITMLTACGKNSNINKKTTFKIMCWNDDFRYMMEKYFIPRHEKLMKNMEIEWINDEIVKYADNVENRLNSGESIDLFLGDDKMAARFANNPNVSSLSEMNITEDELAAQYHYTRVLASDTNGIQKGAAFNAEPGIIIYRADYAEQYLGITHQEEMQELLSSWDTFLSVAQKLNDKTDGKIKMLTGSADIWKSIEGAMTGLWTSDGKLAVSEETMAKWLNYIKSLDKCNAFLDTKIMSDDWYDAINDGVFCFFSAPWLNKDTALDNADTNTIFSASKRNGKSFGKWKTSLAPGGFTYGGNWLYSSANSTNKQIAGEIIRAFTCDSEFMRLIALGNMEYVNNTDVIQKLSESQISNPMFKDLDAFSVYVDAANGLEIQAPSVYDNDISRLLYEQTAKYSDDKISLETASYNFRYNVWKKYNNITEKPEPIDKK